MPVAIPSKEKTIYRDFSVEPYEVMRLTAELTCQYAVRAWNWLKSHKPGWKTTVEEMARRFRCSVASVYRGLTELEKRKLLIRTDDSFRLTVPTDPPILTTANMREEGDRADTPARSAPEVKDKTPTYLPNEYSEREKKGGEVAAPEKPRPSRRSEDTTEEKLPPKRPVPTDPQRPPRGAPDHAGRAEIALPDRLPSIEAFLKAWGDEFSDGPSSTTYMTLPAMWQERVIWIYRHWTADEIRTAFITTVDATPRKGWPYFRACLERMAKGEWGKGGSGFVRTETGIARAGDVSAPRPPSEEDSRPSGPLDIATIARSLGYDPDDLTSEQRTECITAAMRGRR